MFVTDYGGLLVVFISMPCKFHSMYEQISLVNMAGNQQSVNICYSILMMQNSKFMAESCLHINLT